MAQGRTPRLVGVAPERVQDSALARPGLPNSLGSIPDSLACWGLICSIVLWQTTSHPPHGVVFGVQVQDVRRPVKPEIAGATPVSDAWRSLRAILVLTESAKPWANPQGRFLRARPLWAKPWPLGGAGACWGWPQNALELSGPEKLLSTENRALAGSGEMLGGLIIRCPSVQTQKGEEWIKRS